VSVSVKCEERKRDAPRKKNARSKRRYSREEDQNVLWIVSLYFCSRLRTITFSHAFLPHPEGGSFFSSVAALPLVAAGCVCRQPTSEMREGKGEGSVYE
jgi:hypothetical protein